MTVIRQEVRPRVSYLLTRFVEGRHVAGWATACRHTIETVSGTSRKDNYALAVPCSAWTSGILCQRLNRAARDLHFLEFRSGGEKSYDATVRRPEGILGVFSSSKRLRGK